MSKRFFFFVVVLIFCLDGEIFSQQNYPSSVTCLQTGDTVFQQVKMRFAYKPPNTASDAGINLSQRITIIPNHLLTPGKFRLMAPIQANCYSSTLGFFCQKELQLEKLTNIPIRFRLGSLEYTDYLEGKPNTSPPR